MPAFEGRELVTDRPMALETEFGNRSFRSKFLRGMRICVTFRAHDHLPAMRFVMTGGALWLGRFFAGYTIGLM